MLKRNGENHGAMYGRGFGTQLHSKEETSDPRISENMLCILI